MSIDITSIISENTFLNVKKKCTFKSVIERIRSYQLIDDYKNSTILLLDDDVELYFELEMFSYGIILLCYNKEFICLGTKLNKATILDDFCSLLDNSNISYTKDEFIKEWQINLVLSSGSTFIFSNDGNEFILSKILWGKEI